MAKIIHSPLVLPSEVMHARTMPRINKFKYSSTYFAIPLKKTEPIKSRFLSFNRSNFFSISDQDYAHKANIEKVLFDHQINKIENITLITCAKTLFYVFNPVSFYLCFDKSDNLIAVLAEVSNRSSQTHSYLIFNKNFEEIRENQWLEAQKEFYVSPFLKREGKYKFRFVIKDQESFFYINYLLADKLILSTYLSCKYQEFSDKNLLKQFFKSPFSTFKTTFLIHWQASKLFFKGIKFNKCPLPLKNKITINQHD